MAGFRVDGQFSGKGEGAVRQGRPTDLDFLLGEYALSFGLVEGLGDVAVQLIPEPFSRSPGEQSAVGADQDEGRPGPDKVVVPDFVSVVDDHRMFDVVADDRLPDIFRILFVVKFGGVHTDHQEGGFPVLSFQISQIRQDVQAIDAAVGPEVEEHDMPLQQVEGQGAVRVEPKGGFRKSGRLHRIHLAGCMV